MTPISSLFRFFFIFSVITVALVGFFFDETPFLRLAALNGVLLFVIYLIVRFAKVSTGTSSFKKMKSAPVQEMDTVEDSDSTDESLEAPKTSSHAHHQQFVKYTYKHKKKRKETSVIWVFVLLVVGGFYAYMNRPATVPTPALNEYSQDILHQDDSLSGKVVTGDVVSASGQVLSTGLSTGVSANPSLVANTGTKPATPAVVATGKSTLVIDDTKSVSLLEAIVYLLQTHNTALYSQKDVKFIGISTTNAYYKYRYTAYKLGLVGKISSPSTLISCQTYMVLKGMLEKWNVQYTTVNVKPQFWAEAEKRGVLNGCVFGKFLKGANLD